MPQNNQVFRFETNVPTQLALQTVQGLRVGSVGKWQMLFVTVSGKRVYFDEETAAKIQRLVTSDEPFFVRKRRGGFDVWLSPASEMKRAAEEASEVARQLRDTTFGGRPSVADLPGVSNGNGANATPSPTVGTLPPATLIPFPAHPPRPEELEPLKPTGTDSLPVPRPVAQPRPFLASSRPAPPGRVGYGAALAEICKTVKSVLCETGLVLGDGPTQDLISTVFIAAQKEKAIDCDFGEAA